jgi:hypothetical protein
MPCPRDRAANGPRWKRIRVIPQGASIDPNKRPFIVFDPRAGAMTGDTIYTDGGYHIRG